MAVGGPSSRVSGTQTLDRVSIQETVNRECPHLTAGPPEPCTKTRAVHETPSELAKADPDDKTLSVAAEKRVPIGWVCGQAPAGLRPTPDWRLQGRLRRRVVPCPNCSRCNEPSGHPLSPTLSLSPAKHRACRHFRNGLVGRWL